MKVVHIGANLDDLTPNTDEVKFKYVTSFALLGVNIDNRLLKQEENFELRKKWIWQKIKFIYNMKLNYIKNIPYLSTGVPTINDGLTKETNVRKANRHRLIYTEDQQ